MATLLLRLVGPMQSWGTTSRFDERDTQTEPSKSGVIGLLCCALGRDREQPVDDLAALRIAVRVDREGVVLRDYQTATGVFLASGTRDDGRTVVSPRYYLSDACFVVGLEGQRAVLERCHVALRDPVWPLFLGRKAFVPGDPVWLPNALSDLPLHEALDTYPVQRPQREAGAPLRFVFESCVEGALRMDQPIGPFSKRRFGPRYARQEMRHVAAPTGD